MYKRLCAAAVALAGTASMSVAVASAAPSATTVPVVSGNSAGLQANALDGAVTSGPFAYSELSATNGGHHTSNSVATADIPRDAHTATIATEETSSGSRSTTLSLVSHAVTQNVTLLGGTVTADAADTSAGVAYSGGMTTTSADTDFVKLVVNGTPIAASPAPNTVINLPGGGTVTLNFQKVTRVNAVQATVTAAAIVVRLPQGSGATVVKVDPVRASVGLVTRGQAAIGGFAFAVRAATNAENTRVLVGPVPLYYMPAGGTRGRDKSRSVAAVDLGSAGTASVATSTVNGLLSDQELRSTTSASVSRVNLLGGGVTASVITAMAQVDLPAGQKHATASESNTFTDLQIGGVVVPTSVAPNTVYQLPGGIGTVTVNAQSSAGNTADATAVQIKLTTAAFGLAAGANIVLGRAHAGLTPGSQTTTS